MTGLFPMILDGLVILLLGGTIAYCIRLSAHIAAFRESRADMEKILTNLSANIEQAGRAIDGLRQGAREAGRDLQERINEARTLGEELEIMSESGNRLASRLETLAEKSSRATARRTAGVRDLGDMLKRMERDEEDAPPPPRMSVEKQAPRAAPAFVPPSPPPAARKTGFSIRDREYEEEDAAPADAMDREGVMRGDREEDEAAGSLSSRAERELYEALRRRRTEAGGVS